MSSNRRKVVLEKTRKVFLIHVSSAWDWKHPLGAEAVRTKKIFDDDAFHTRMILFSNDQFLSLIDTYFDQKIIKTIQKMAKDLLKHEHIFVIGKNLMYPAALEFALKIKETSYIHTEGFAAGELKHGVISLIEQGTPVFVLAENNDQFDEICSSAAQVKARGAYTIGISPKPSQQFGFYLPTPDLGSLNVFTHVMIGQLFGYYLGIGKNTDPDKPRNLAKSVTVK